MVIFLFCEIIVGAICSDLEHDVETIFYLPSQLTGSGNLSLNMIDAQETANHSYFKRFPDSISS